MVKVSGSGIAQNVHDHVTAINKLGRPSNLPFLGDRVGHPRGKVRGPIASTAAGRARPHNVDPCIVASDYRLGAVRTVRLSSARDPDDQLGAFSE